MKQLFRLTVGCLALGALSVATGPAQADSPGPYYATPSWDQTLPAATRFIVLSNFDSEAVLDRETGLVWEKSPQTATATWSSARFACTERTTGNRKGWRLPSMPELASLEDPTKLNPALPPGHPFTNVQGTIYWSATSSAEDTTNAWAGNFSVGAVAFQTKTINLPVWCVRGGMNADAY